MTKYYSTMKNYWNDRFRKENHVWGESPSKTAHYALKLFGKYEVKDILVPGAGYGRNSKLFSVNNYNVTGIEISDIAFNLSKGFDPKTKFYNGNILDMPYDDMKYDAIYSFNVLHLFRKNEREILINKCFEKLKTKGIIFITSFSDNEKSYGKGIEVESNTFESKPGRPV